MISAVKDTLAYYESTNIPVAQLVRTTVEKATSIAIPLIVIFAAANIQGAEAGPLAYASCMVGCAAMPPICAAGGWAACLIALAAPTP